MPDDADGRRRLFELYGRGLDVVAPIERYVERTAGASAAHEMVVEGGALTQSLLGGPTSRSPSSPDPTA